MTAAENFRHSRVFLAEEAVHGCAGYAPKDGIHVQKVDNAYEISNFIVYRARVNASKLRSRSFVGANSFAQYAHTAASLCE